MWSCSGGSPPSGFLLAVVQGGFHCGEWVSHVVIFTIDQLQQPCVMLPFLLDGYPELRPILKVLGRFAWPEDDSAGIHRWGRLTHLSFLIVLSLHISRFLRVRSWWRWRCCRACTCCCCLCHLGGSHLQGVIGIWFQQPHADAHQAQRVAVVLLCLTDLFNGCFAGRLLLLHLVDGGIGMGLQCVHVISPGRRWCAEGHDMLICTSGGRGCKQFRHRGAWW